MAVDYWQQDTNAIPNRCFSNANKQTQQIDEIKSVKFTWIECLLCSERGKKWSERERREDIDWNPVSQYTKQCVSNASCYYIYIYLFHRSIWTQSKHYYKWTKSLLGLYNQTKFCILSHNHPHILDAFCTPPFVSFQLKPILISRHFVKHTKIAFIWMIRLFFFLHSYQRKMR